MSGRHDFYSPIHKGLRLGSARMLTALGNADWRDAAAARGLLQTLKTHLALAKEHLEHEDAEIIPPLRAKAPEMSNALDHDHEDHYATFRDLDEAIREVEAAPSPDQRAMCGQSLYIRFSIYFADDLVHMAREENEALPLFHALFTDAELQEMEGRIIASIPPARLTQYYEIMIPGMSPAERAAFLRYVQAVAPPEAYQHLYGVAQSALAGEAARQLDADLAIAA
ncbi:MAG TPA: hemerythrin domain-containing protein [Caulobacterales bacterium]|nr:hemerythrin domain-containing protein [Caulobacterales bacterium]